jgi:hypothetical protein
MRFLRVSVNRSFGGMCVDFSSPLEASMVIGSLRHEDENKLGKTDAANRKPGKPCADTTLAQTARTATCPDIRFISLHDFDRIFRCNNIDRNASAVVPRGSLKTC